MSLTTLLVLYTLFSNTSDALPTTANVKMIDVWFFYCIFLLFFIILSHVMVEHLDEGAGVVRPQGVSVKVVRVAVNRQDRFMRTLRVLVVPGVVLIFNLVYWAVMFSPNKIQ